MKALLVLGIFLSSAGYAAVTSPDNHLTPGVLCSSTDPNFMNYDYPEHVARCNRNIQMPEKDEVAKNYGGFPKSDYPKYEFDHLIPLCAGGSDDIKNLWPQPIDQAKKKDVLENDICLQMKAGTLTQAAAVTKVHDWFASNVIHIEEGPAAEAAPGQVLCVAPGIEKVLFTIVNANSITKASVLVTSAAGDQEAVRDDNVIQGRAVITKGPLLKGLIRYSLMDKVDKDRFELFLPADLMSLQKDFKGFLKIAFDGNYPKLSPINCSAK